MPGVAVVNHRFSICRWANPSGRNPPDTADGGLRDPQGRGSVAKDRMSGATGAAANPPYGRLEVRETRFTLAGNL